MILFLILVAVVCIAVVIIVMKSVGSYVANRKKIVKIDKLRELPTGSLILVVRTKMLYLMSIAGISSTHTSILVWKGEVPYIVEHSKQAGKSKEDSFARLVPLTYYTNDKDNAILARKYTGPPIDITQIIGGMSRLSDRYINTNYIKDFLYNHYSFNDSKTDVNSKAITCAEYNYLLLCDLLDMPVSQYELTDAYRYLENDCTQYFEPSVNVM